MPSSRQEADIERNPPDKEIPDSPISITEPKQSILHNVLSRVATHLIANSIPDPPPPPPDGGLKAWTQVGCGFLVVFATWGYVNSFGAFQAYYTQILPSGEYPPSTISWIGSIQVWLTFFVGAFSGRLLDAGLFLPTIVVGALVQLVGIFLMSISTQYWHLMLTQGVLTGIGGGIFFTPAMGLIATYFDRRRAVAVGLSTLGNSTGGLIYPVVVRELLPRVGFGWTARVLGFINVFCLGVVLAFMRPRLPPRTSGPVVDWTAFAEPVYMFFVGGMFFLTWGLYYTYYYIASFGTQSLGMTYQEASVMVMVTNGVGLPARLFPPWFADRFGCMNVVIPISLSLAVSAFSWLAVRDQTGFYVWTVIYGFWAGAIQCVMPSSVASITNRLDIVGTRLGMAFSMISFASLTGPPIGGLVQARMGGSFVGSIWWAAAATFLCFVFFAISRGMRAGWRLRAHV